MLNYSVQLCYNARSKYVTLLGQSMLQCSVQVRCIARSKYVTLSGPSMLYASVQVCYNARSKYVTWIGRSMLRCSVQVCYTARLKYATVLSQTMLHCPHKHSPGDPKLAAIYLHIFSLQRNPLAHISVPGNRVPMTSNRTAVFPCTFHIAVQQPLQPHRSCLLLHIMKHPELHLLCASSL